MAHPVSAAALRALEDAAPEVMWLDDPLRPPALEPLTAADQADLVVVGGGYTGLWTALRSKERFPERDVVILEAGECGWQASGRNGGFAAASLTHGFGNGLARWPDELAELDRLGGENLDAIGDVVARYGLDCDWETTGGLDVATAPHQVQELADYSELMQRAGHDVRLLDGTETRALVKSPTYLAGLLEPRGVAMVEPARLAWGLRRACLDLGVRIFEQTLVTALHDDGRFIEVETDRGIVRCDRVALATNGYPPLLRRLRMMTVPVYDHVLATEPLTEAQLASIGWQGRQGVGDSSNLFHYYRLTRDNRILWGGYDAVYHFGSKIAPELEQNNRTHQLLAGHFFETFPQLEGLNFTHRWGGVIDTCTRFAAFFGTAKGGRVGYAMGYTGLGVAATRFGADVMLDLLYGEETERTRLQMVRERPLPFPPEPARSIGINLTRWSLARADANAGKRNAWLRTLDRFGLGFDS
jgi:glycine/D-amino acid oxidase-like deaminating enzyme